MTRHLTKRQRMSRRRFERKQAKVERGMRILLEAMAQRCATMQEHLWSYEARDIRRLQAR